MRAAKLTHFAWLSIAAALVTIVLKTSAWFITGSVGLLSDAAESLINLAGAIMALAMLSVAARPADADHAYGHGKAEYFSSGLEGALILIAAIGIVVAAVGRLLHPQPLQQVGLGVGVACVASIVNLVVAIIVLRAGRRSDSVTLQANAHHLFTDVWTSVGVLVSVLAVKWSGWLWLDPVVALLVAANICFTGVRIVRQAVLGLMDTALSPVDQQAIQAVLVRFTQERVQFHALRTRQSGSRRFVSVHVLVPGDWTVQRGHDLLEEIEAALRSAVPNSTVFTHLESIDDPLSWQDQDLEREHQN
jgi:cation diffusion facilitator family transporter